MGCDPVCLMCRPTELEKVQELLQDPRPLDEKATVVGMVRQDSQGGVAPLPLPFAAQQAARAAVAAAAAAPPAAHATHHARPCPPALQEAEDTLVEFLQRGAGIEADVLANIKAALPAELAQQLEAIIPPAPVMQPVRGCFSPSPDRVLQPARGLPPLPAAVAALVAGSYLLQPSAAPAPAQPADPQHRLTHHDQIHGNQWMYNPTPPAAVAARSPAAPTPRLTPWTTTSPPWCTRQTL
jgi:hypothetical protein